MRAPILSLVAVLVAATARSAAAQSPRVWTVAPVPVTSIGVIEGDPQQELANVSGARRFSDGRVVVANGKPRELRVYSAAGKFLGRIGRTGDGPGEYRGRLDLLAAGGDSLLVYDQASTRVIFFSSAGRLLKQWPAASGGSFRGQTILFHRTLGVTIPARLNHCFRELVMALPPLPPPALRTVRYDGDGHFWVHADSDATWSVHSTSGQRIGAIRLPAKFDVEDVQHGYVVGKTLTDDDVEEIQVVRTAGGPAPSPIAACGSVADSFGVTRGERSGQLITGLRNAMTAGEMAYSNYSSYVSTLDSLPSLKEKLPAESAFRVLQSSNRGWSAALFDRRTTLVCLFGLSDAMPAGWPDGTVRCSE